MNKRQRLSLQAYIQTLENGTVSLLIATRKCSPVEISTWQSVAAAKKEAVALGCAVILVSKKEAA